MTLIEPFIQLIFLLPRPQGEQKKSIYTPSGVGASKLIIYPVMSF
jgi:hypothetical protein